MTTIKDAKPETDHPRPSRFRLPEVIDWSLVAVYALRALGVLTIIKALALWMYILDMTLLVPVSFEQAALGFQATIVFFAVFDLVTGIGLWLTAAWGGALWLASVFLKLVIDIVNLMDAGGVIEQLSRPAIAGIIDLILVACYVIITAKSALQHRSG